MVMSFLLPQEAMSSVATARMGIICFKVFKDLGLLIIGFCSHETVGNGKGGHALYNDRQA